MTKKLDDQLVDFITKKTNTLNVVINTLDAAYNAVASYDEITTILALANVDLMKLPIFTTISKDKILSRINVEEQLSLRTVLVNKFDEVSAKQFYTDMSIAENSDQEVIPIFIDSYGGAVYSLLSMIDTIKASQKKIATISLSKSMSCGAVLLTCGHEGLRFASSRSTIMIHDVSSATHGKVEDIKVDAKEIERVNTMVYSLMEENCGQKSGTFKDAVHERGHADWYLTAEDAKKYNIVNHIRIPKFDIKVSAVVSFG